MLMLLIKLLFELLLLSQKYTEARIYKRNVIQENVRYVFKHFRCGMSTWSELARYLPESRRQDGQCYVTIEYLRPYPAVNHSMTIHLYSGSQSLTGSRSVELCHVNQHAVKLNFSCRISQTARINDWCFSNNDCVPRYSVCSVTDIYGQCTCQNGTKIDRGGCLKHLALDEQWKTNEDRGVYSAHCKYNTCQCKNGYYGFHGNCIKENVSFRSPCLINRQCEWFGGTCKNGRCGCPYGHDLWNDTCIKKNIQFRSPCLTNRQCHAFGGTCQHGQCRCPNRYFLLNKRCTIGNIKLGSLCHYRQQCTGTPNASLCLGKSYSGKCSCNIGFVELNRSCIENVSYGQKCLTSSQCQSFGGTCHNNQCLCPYEHLLLNGTCVKGYKTLGSSCLYRQQCTGTPNASLCLGNSSDGKCSCDIGFVELNRSCIVALALGFSVGGLVIGAAFTILLCVIYNMRQMRKTRNQGAYELREMRNVHCSTAIYNEFPEDHNGELEVEENEDVDSTLGSPCIESVQNEIYNHLNEEDEDQDDMENKYDYVEPVQSTPRQFVNDDVYMAATFPQNPCLYELQRVLKTSTSTE